MTFLTICLFYKLLQLAFPVAIKYQEIYKGGKITI